MIRIPLRTYPQGLRFHRGRHGAIGAPMCTCAADGARPNNAPSGALMNGLCVCPSRAVRTVRHSGVWSSGGYRRAAEQCPSSAHVPPLSKTVWPSGLRRWLQAPVRKGVGSNPTAVTCPHARPCEPTLCNVFLCRGVRCGTVSCLAVCEAVACGAMPCMCVHVCAWTRAVYTWLGACVGPSVRVLVWGGRLV